jgi:hypothetical protein
MQEDFTADERAADVFDQEKRPEKGWGDVGSETTYGNRSIQ